jgi:hypothetical protein
MALRPVAAIRIRPPRFAPFKARAGGRAAGGRACGGRAGVRRAGRRTARGRACGARAGVREAMRASHSLASKPEPPKSLPRCEQARSHSPSPSLRCAARGAWQFLGAGLADRRVINPDVRDTLAAAAALIVRRFPRDAALPSAAARARLAAAALATFAGPEWVAAAAILAAAWPPVPPAHRFRPGPRGPLSPLQAATVHVLRGPVPPRPAVYTPRPGPAPPRSAQTAARSRPAPQCTDRGPVPPRPVM